MIPSHKTLLLTVLLLLAAAPAAGAVWREQSAKDVDAKGLREILVENAVGSVVLRGSPDDRIHLTALKIVRVSQERRARELARRTTVLTSISSGRFRVRVRYPQRQSVHVGLWEMLSGFEFPRVEVRLEIQVPAALAASVESTSGDVTSERVAGPQHLESTSGDVSIQGARGPLEAETSSGDVVATDVGAARLKTVSGDVRIEGASGPVVVRSSSGDITAQGAEDSLALGTASGGIRVGVSPRGLSARSTSGDLVVHRVSGGAHLETSSGNISLERVEAVGLTQASTTSGDIVVRLAPSLRCRLDLETTSGTLDVSVPLQIESVSRHHVVGRVRGGTSWMRLSSSSGDIAVRSGGQP